MPVLSVCSQFAWFLLVIGLGLLCIRARRDHPGLVTGGTLLGSILADWGMDSHYPMSKEVLVYYCNTV